MNTITIGIAGGTGSGKSTFTNRLKRYFGDRISVLYHDNYYKRQDDIPFEERVKVNYDHPDALETDLFVEHLRALKNGQTILCPVGTYTISSGDIFALKYPDNPSASMAHSTCVYTLSLSVFPNRLTTTTFTSGLATVRSTRQSEMNELFVLPRPPGTRSSCTSA